MSPDPEHWTHEQDVAAMERYHDLPPEQDRPSGAEIRGDQDEIDEQTESAAAKARAEIIRQARKENDG